MKDFHLIAHVAAPAAEVQNRISKVDKWWAKQFKGAANKLNDQFSVYFGDTYVDFKISELIPGKKIVWKVTDCNLHWIKDKKEWNDTEVTWAIAEKDGRTQIDFVHKGLTPVSECYESCKPGWTHHIKDSLLKLIENGEGFPE